MSSNGKNANVNIDNGKLLIDWKKVNKMSKENQSIYFKRLYLRILKMPIEKPVPVLLGNKYYVTDEKYKDILVEAYKRCNGTEKNSGIKHQGIDWQKVEKMTLAEREVYFKNLIKQIEREPIVDPISFSTKFGFCVINRTRESLYRDCIEQYDIALKGLSDSFKREPHETESVDKQPARKKETTKVKRELKKEPKALIIPPLYVKPKGRLACSIVALAMATTYAANLVATVFSSFSAPLKKTVSLNDEAISKPSAYSMMSADEVIKLNSQVFDGTNPYLEHNSTLIEEKLEEGRLERESRLEEERLALEKARRVALIDAYFEEYCLYFNLDSEKVIQIAKDMTNDYEVSLTTLFEDHLYDDVDDEAAVMVFVRQIFRDRLGFKLSELGLTKDDLKRNNDQIETLSLDIKSNSSDSIETEQSTEDIQNQDNLLYAFESMKPADFLMNQLNYTPSSDDLKLIDYLMLDLKLKPNIVNVILNYVLGNTDEILDHEYIKRIVVKYGKLNEISTEEAIMIVKQESEYNLKKASEEQADETDLTIYSDFVAPTLNEDGVPVARNGEVFSKYIGRISDMIDLDKNYALALCLHETWRGTSELCLKQNNYGGMRANGDWFTFPSPEAGMIAFCINLNAYKKYHFEDKEDPWQSFANKYAEGSLSWQENYKAFYREVIRDSEKYFGTEEEVQELDETTDSVTKPKVFSMEIKKDVLS